MSRAELVEKLGPPSEKLSPDVWAYCDFRIIGGPGRERGDALIVVFANERASRLRFTRRHAAELAWQRMRTAAAATAVAGK